jgi:hypothetical protein
MLPKLRHERGWCDAIGMASIALRGADRPSWARLARSFYHKEAILRPRLHPDMGQTVLCARVARQLAGLSRGYDGPIPPPNSWYATLALRSLPLDYPGFLRLAIHSLGVYLDLGYTSSQWLNQVLEASHFGHSFRRCFFFEYKENRRPYPRVTNRGVQNSSKRRTDTRRLGFGDE